MTADNAIILGLVVPLAVAVLTPVWLTARYPRHIGAIGRHR